MNTRDILGILDIEIARLQQARSTIAGLSSPKRRGRPAGFSVTTKAPKKRTMSAAGRKRIAEAQRKRWAAQKAGKKK
jgi:hypothetical protein